MSSVTLFNRLETGPRYDGDGAAAYADAPRHKLRRTGMRAYVFDGVEVCSATSHSPGPSLWYEINLYRKTSGHLVLEIRFFSKVDGMKDRFHVFEGDGVEDVARLLEGYEPAMDVDPDINPEDEDSPIAIVALKTAMLRIRIDEARRQFRDLAGEMLHQLDA